MAPEAPTFGTVDAGQSKLGERRGDPAEQIKSEELHVAEAVLDIVAEDPQKQHVAEEMQPAAMHEHGGENGDDVPGRVRREFGRDERPMLDGLVAG